MGNMEYEMKIRTKEKLAKLKELIIVTSDDKKQSELIYKYNKIVQEIKNIKNKELE